MRESRREPSRPPMAPTWRVTSKLEDRGHIDTDQDDDQLVGSHGQVPGGGGEEDAQVVSHADDEASQERGDQTGGGDCSIGSLGVESRSAHREQDPPWELSGEW